MHIIFELMENCYGSEQIVWAPPISRQHMVKGKTKQMLLETENEPMPIMTQQQRNALAERIAVVLRERKRLGEERRSREREYQRRNNERALSRYYKVRGEFHEQSKGRLKELDLVYDTIMSSNAVV